MQTQERLRLHSQTRAILDRLKQGPDSNVELASIALKYTSRISDARKRGVTILCRKVSAGLTEYALAGQNGQVNLF